MLPMFEDHRQFDVSTAMYAPLGFASPLWLPFAAATSAGLAFWWMTRWTRPANLEALMEVMAPPPTPSTVAEPALPTAEPVLAAVDSMTAQTEEIAETAAEAMETIADETQEAVVTALEAADPVEPVVPPAVKKKPKPAPDAPLH